MAPQGLGYDGLWILVAIFAGGAALVWLLFIVGMFFVLRRHNKDAAEWRASLRSAPADPKIKSSR